MVAFTIVNPTRIAFGRGMISMLGKLLPPGVKPMLIYGGGSIRRNGIYHKVVDALGDLKWVEFGGIEVNPHYETILKAAEVCRSEQVDFILAVGGGSVVDAAKFLAGAVHCNGDVWTEFSSGQYPANILPVGVVLTLPATGSESNSVSVITSVTKRLKVPFSNDRVRPVFAILDPDTMGSLDERQLSNGAVDAFTHVVEQYATLPANTPVQYGYSETLLRVLIEWGPKLATSRDERACENVMWAANQALNGVIGAGVSQDWSTHMIGHAITELYGIDHARTLTVVMPSLLRFKIDQKKAMLARMARQVWAVEIDDDTVAANAAIDGIEAFFRTMKMPVKLADLSPHNISADDIVAHLERAGQNALGEQSDITPQEVLEILRLAA